MVLGPCLDAEADRRRLASLIYRGWPELRSAIEAAIPARFVV
jgi:hypothetical protein